ncbi:MAG TPA: hypothetical protein DCG49_06765 [Ruminococcus sp.]|nr:hypothetical protein [Ruminococcus sp.]
MFCECRVIGHIDGNELQLRIEIEIQPQSGESGIIADRRTKRDGIARFPLSGADCEVKRCLNDSASSKQIIEHIHHAILIQVSEISLFCHSRSRISEHTSAHHGGESGSEHPAAFEVHRKVPL